MMITVHLFISG